MVPWGPTTQHVHKEDEVEEVAKMSFKIAENQISISLESRYI